MGLSKVKSGVGGAAMQTVFVIVSLPHSKLSPFPPLILNLFRIIKLIEYVPELVNVTPSTFVPHVAVLLLGFERPIDPDDTFQPTGGLITQFLLLSESQMPLLCTTTPAIDVFVKVIVELIQAVEFGEMLKSAMGLVAVVIGSTAASKYPHGFSALILT